MSNGETAATSSVSSAPTADLEDAVDWDAAMDVLAAAEQQHLTAQLVGRPPTKRKREVVSAPYDLSG